MTDSKDEKIIVHSSKDELTSLGEQEQTAYDTFGVPVWDEEKVRAFYATLDDDSKDYMMEITGHGMTLEEKETLTPDLLYLLDKLLAMPDSRAIQIFQDTLEEHADDTNFPTQDIEFITGVASGEIDISSSPQTNFKARMLATLYYYHSPYPEVRAVTDVFNDAEEPVETIRSYTISIIWLIIGSGVNEFFYHRMPSIKLYSSVISVLMYPCGKLWELIMPKWHVPWFGGKRIPLNPGPYSYKEQMFGTLFSGVSATTIYVSSNIITQKIFYKQDWVNFGFQILLTLSTQCLGLAFSGIMRKFVIYPARAMWPTMLPTLALNRALLKPERKEIIHGWKVSRYYFFWIVFWGMFVYFWLPNYLFQALSYFSWMTWISPYNFNLSMITGSNSGLGFNPVPTFDWNNMSALLSPLAQPWSTVWNSYLGGIIGFIIIVAMYWSNYKWSAYLPINSNDIFTNTGESFDVTEILTNGLLDLEKYQQYSPPYYSAANILVYGAFFAVYPLTFFYNTFKEWRVISRAFKMMYINGLEFFHDFTFKKIVKDDFSAYSKFDDAHSRMMTKYKEVPDWWYMIILVISFVFAVLTVEVYSETKTPVWALVFVIAINFVFLIPFSVLYAVTGVSLGLNVLVELIIGYALQGNGTALMTLKAYGYNIDGQADSFISSLKIGHYAKLPPRSVFRAQITATIVQAFVSLAVVNWSLSNIDGYCDEDQPQKFSCPQERTYYSASVFWGVIGPKVVFSGIYPEMQYAFLMGFGIALIFIALSYYGPRYSWYKYVSSLEPTVIIVGILNCYAPYNLSYYTGGLYASFAFMYYIKRRYLAWFEKYNYVLSAGLDAGVAFSAVIIFFAVQYHAKDVSWWGNNVPYEGIEGGYGQQTLLDITTSEKGYFGPEMGHYPEP